jgi:hypothetical protein
MAAYNKPLPITNSVTGVYWDYCKQHELRIQRCKSCRKYRHYPLELCPHCNSFDVEWVKASGKGSVYSYIVPHRAFHPGFADEVPYVVATVELDEGVRMISRLADIKPEDVKIGMRLKVDFQDVTPEFTLPVFKRA